MFQNIELIKIPNFLECVKEYIQRRYGRVYKKQKRLFITQRKPYHAVLIVTLRRWIKKTFSEANLAENFTPHSYRSASTTKIFITNLDIFGFLDILRKSCWNNAKASLQHYNKEIVCYEGIDFNKIMEY